MDPGGSEVRVGKSFDVAVARALTAVSAAAAAAACVLAAVDGRGPLQLLAEHQGIGIAVGLTYPAVGVLVLARSPRNALGWVLVTSGTSLGLYVLAVAIGESTAGAGTFGGLAAWLGTWLNMVGIAASSTLSLLLFPDGRLPSPRWRPLLWWSLALSTVGPAVVAVLAWPARGPALVGADPPTGAAGVAWITVFALSLVTGLLALASAVVRLRGARGVLRQQMAWFVYLSVVTQPFQLVGPVRVVGPVFEILQYLALLAGIVIGIRRYRLWDIDRIVNRTLVYGSLTAVLVGVYAIGVLVAGQLVGSPGQGRDWVVAVTTLGTAMAANPLRRMIQRSVDRRFDRERYDAVQTVRRFGDALRTEVSLSAVRRDLIGVASGAVSPVSVGVWLPGARD